MILKKLDIYNVRNIQKASLEPSSGINFIHGSNASGKSSLLEAIYILGRAKSFRSSTIKKIINVDHNELIVSGKAFVKDNNNKSLGIQLTGTKVLMQLNNQRVFKRSDLAYAFPLQIVHPTSYRMIDGGSQGRREFMDWGIFNLHSDFLPCWRKFKKCLQQRNILLKKKQLRHIEVWNHELVQYGTIIDEYRKNYLNELQPVFYKIAEQFFDIKQIDFKYESGWGEKRDYLQILIQDIDRDSRYGFTHTGPHRGDFKLLINRKFVKDFVSRGQLKLMVLAMNLAQVILLNQINHQNTCVLIDDLASELDLNNRVKLLHILSMMNTQVYLTAISMADFGDISGIMDYSMFHVEHGNIMQRDVPRGT